MARLRAPGGCPWDREQTLQSLKPYLIEEAYEVLDAIDDGSPSQHCEELGDVLLQIVFQSQIASETHSFDAHDVVDTLCRKLIRRHPHVFGDESADTPAEVMEHWQRIKAEEKAEASPADSPTDHVPSALDGLAKSFPPLLTAHKLSSKAAKVGFDWPSYHEVWDKVEEEMEELRQAMQLHSSDPDRHKEISWELGDLLFALVNLARHLGTDPSESLRKANRRFSERFKLVEAMASQKGLDISKADSEALEELWQAAKASLRET